MELEKIKNKIGQEVVLILKNGFRYTCVIPEFSGTSFTINDKYGKDVDIECEYIATIITVGDKKEEEGDDK